LASNSYIVVDSLNNQSNAQNILGKMKVGDSSYSAVCKCDPVSPVKEPTKESGPKCDPAKLNVKAEKQGIGASYDNIKSLLGNIEELNYVLITESSFKCLDGRNTGPVLGTPGGDAGEFIIALSVYEDLIGGGRKLNQDSVDTFFVEYLKFMKQPKFYMCTDDMAVNHIQTQLSIEGLNINSPRLSLLPDLFKVILQPENIGDLHLKMMMKYPQQFSIRKEIIDMFLTSFFKLLWNTQEKLSTKLELEVLTGSHKEVGFIEVRSEEACQKQQLAPLIPTKNKFISVFVNHLDAASVRRAQLSSFFSDKVNHHQDPVDPIKMHNRLNHHGYISLEITGSYIAKGLPFYTINLA